MPSENVEIVKRLLDAFRRRDNQYPFTVYDPEIVWDMRRSPIPDAQEVYHGHDGIRRYWREWLAAWDEIEFEVEEVVAAGEQVVSFVSTQRNHARSTGLWMDMGGYAQIWTFSQGKVVRVEYGPRDDARRAFGLDPLD